VAQPLDFVALLVCHHRFCHAAFAFARISSMSFDASALVRFSLNLIWDARLLAVHRFVGSSPDTH
jgi:hypothetical protein